MYFLIEAGDLLETDNTIWDKSSADIKREFDRKPAYKSNDWTVNIIFFVFLIATKKTKAGKK